MIDPFYLKSGKEIEVMIREFWQDIEYLTKMKILLKAYSHLNITKIENLGINTLWRKLGIEKQKDIYKEQWRY